MVTFSPQCEPASATHPPEHSSNRNLASSPPPPRPAVPESGVGCLALPPKALPTASGPYPRGPWLVPSGGPRAQHLGQLQTRGPRALPPCGSPGPGVGAAGRSPARTPAGPPAHLPSAGKGWARGAPGAQRASISGSVRLRLVGRGALAPGCGLGLPRPPSRRATALVSHAPSAPNNPGGSPTRGAA